MQNEIIMVNYIYTALGRSTEIDNIYATKIFRQFQFLKFPCLAIKHIQSFFRAYPKFV